MATYPAKIERVAKHITGLKLCSKIDIEFNGERDIGIGNSLR